MGSLVYDGRVTHFDDRTLTHMQIIIAQKLTRNESLLVSWKDSAAVGDGRTAIWLAPNIPILFKFSGSRVPSIDKAWLERLGESAGASTGMIVTDAEGNYIAAEADDGDYPGRGFERH